MSKADPHPSALHSADDESFLITTLDRFKQIVINPFLSSHPSELLVDRYSTIVRQASILYHYDVSAHLIGGTTGGVTSVPSETLAYWAFDLLIESVNSPPAGEGVSVGPLILPTLLLRCEGVLRRYIDDVRLRGLVPLPR
jgi:hypothetical protein